MTDGNKPNIVLFGGGNQVKYSIDIIEKENKYNIVGIIDSIKPIGEKIFGYEVIGRQEDIASLMYEYSFGAGIITVGDNFSRKIIHDNITKKVKWFTFVNAIHPSVIIGNDVEIGVGIVAMAGVIINPGAKVRNFTFFATGCQIEHDCTIGTFASVSAGSVLGGHVHVEEFAAITLGVTVVDRVTIGCNTVIGSGSLVTKDIPANVLAYGSPAKIVRTREMGEKFLK
jgi:sugar O-acyltransferase (sialic acid O-acetyltransferase NeuD family)